MCLCTMISTQAIAKEILPCTHEPKSKTKATKVKAAKGKAKAAKAATNTEQLS
jgi:hypothetical protein